MKVIIGLILSISALLVNVVGVAIPYWLTGMGGHAGLWTACSDVLGETICVSLTSDAISGRYQASRAFEVLGMIGMVATVVCVILKITAMKENGILPKLSAAFACVSGIFMFVGCGLFASMDATGLSLSAGFALCIVAGVIAIPAGVCNFLGGR